jgi:hypothetical protein
MNPFGLSPVTSLGAVFGAAEGNGEGGATGDGVWTSLDQQETAVPDAPATLPASPVAPAENVPETRAAAVEALTARDACFTAPEWIAPRFDSKEEAPWTHRDEGRQEASAMAAVALGLMVANPRSERSEKSESRKPRVGRAQ